MILILAIHDSSLVHPKTLLQRLHPPCPYKPPLPPTPTASVPKAVAGPIRRLSPLFLLQKCLKSETCSSGQPNWNEAAAHPASYKLHMYLFAILTCGPGTLITGRSQY